MKYIQTHAGLETAPRRQAVRSGGKGGTPTEQDERVRRPRGEVKLHVYLNGSGGPDWETLA